MKYSVIREMSDKELNERLEEEQKQLVRLKLAHAVSPLENPQRLKQQRKLIARLKTELRRRELEKLNSKRTK